MDNRTRKIHFLVEAGLIGALYAVLTDVSSMMGLAYGQVQFRISEALTILPAVDSGRDTGACDRGALSLT